MAKEQKRGCGFRKVGALYLVGDGIAVPCDMMPLKVGACPTCGHEIPFYRGFQWINKQRMINWSEDHHSTKAMQFERCVHTVTGQGLKCPLCFPEENAQQQYGLMWVGGRYYTPESFIAEAKERGVCKKIPRIPAGLELGRTWVMLAHTQCEFPQTDDETKTEVHGAIFYAFVPKRIEMPIWKSQATQKNLEKLKAAGITPVIINDGDEDHAPKKRKKRRRLI